MAKHEAKVDDMIDICQHLHTYVPCQAEKPVKILSGGDYMTFERHKSAQCAVRNSRTPSERLEGLQAKHEEFHTQAEIHKVIWKLLYSTMSAGDIGTLYAARNAIDARNVTRDPHDSFYASAEFLDKYTEALVTTGGLDQLKLESLEVELEFPQDSEQAMVTRLKKLARDFVVGHCLPDVPDIVENVDPVNTCHLCGRVYVRRGNLTRHLKKAHQGEAETVTDHIQEIQDYQYNYVRSALPLLLLRANHNNAIKFADGDRLERCHLFFMPYYKVSSCPKYAYATLEFLAQMRCLLSPRQAHILKWNRTANTKGGFDKNHALDLDVEHENKMFKDHIITYRGEVTENIIRTVSRSVDTSESVSLNFDKVSCVRQQSGRHKIGDGRLGDIHKLVRQYLPVNMYSVVAGRRHAAFPDHSANPLSSLQMDKFRDWMKDCLKKHSNKHYYRV